MAMNAPRSRPGSANPLSRGIGRPTTVWLPERANEHEVPADHPETANRIDACLRGVRLAGSPVVSCSRLATDVELGRVHTSGYIARVNRLEGSFGELDHETPLSPRSVEAAKNAAGCAVEVAERLSLGVDSRALVLARPPGHHAERDAGMGYCVFNNVAVLVRAVQGRGLGRAVVVDWDVHPGNGTADVFRDDPTVLVVDIHEAGLGPALPEAPTVLGLALPAGSDGADYLAALRKVEPRVREHRPEVIAVSCGFDAHERDPLSTMRLTSADFGTLAAHVLRWARELCEGRLVLVLEGGYALEAIEASTTEVLHALDRGLS